MAVLSGTNNVTENGTTSDDVTSGTTTITRLLSYTDRSGTLITVPVAIPAGAAGLIIDTQYGTLNIHQDGTYTYTSGGPNADALPAGTLANDSFSYDFGDPTAVDDGTTTIVTTGVNDAPVAHNDFYTVGVVL